MSIAVADYDAGNIHSAMNALKALSLDEKFTDDPEKVERARFVVLSALIEG